MMSDDNYKIITECVAFKDNYMFCVAREMNIIFKINIESMQLETIIDMPDEDGMVERLYFGIYIDGDNMMLVPWNAKKLWIYSFVSRKWMGIDISEFVEQNMNYKFSGGVLKGEKAYLFGYEYEGILVVDIKSKRMFELLDDGGKNAFYGQCTIEISNKVFIANRLENNVVCINTDNCSYEKLPINGYENVDKYKNDGMSYVNGNYYIMPYQGNYFIKWNPKGTSIKVEIDKIFDTTETIFNGIAASERKILFYGTKKRGYIYDLINSDNSYILDENIYYAHYFKNIGFIICKKGVIDILDADFKLLKKIPVQINSSVYNEYIKRYRISKNILKENSVINLCTFISFLNK